MKSKVKYMSSIYRQVSTEKMHTHTDIIVKTGLKCPADWRSFASRNLLQFLYPKGSSFSRRRCKSCVEKDPFAPLKFTKEINHFPFPRASTWREATSGLTQQASSLGRILRKGKQFPSQSQNSCYYHLIVLFGVVVGWWSAMWGI